jgi:uncharacterized protein YkwD
MRCAARTVEVLAVAVLWTIAGCEGTSPPAGAMFATADTGTGPIQDGGAHSDAIADASGGVGGQVPVSAGLAVRVVDGAVELRRTTASDFAHHCLILRQEPLATADSRGGKAVERKLCTKQAGSAVWLVGEGSGASAWSALAGFRVGPATWRIVGGDTVPKSTTEVASGTLRLGPWFDGPCSSNKAASTGLVQWRDTAPVSLAVEVALQESARLDVDIITPEVWVDTVRATGTGKAGTTLAFGYQATTPGLYVVEVNNLGGGAILNCPVYVAADPPLVPVQVPSVLTGQTAAIDDAERVVLRNQMQELVNGVRALVALPALESAPKLDAIAQAHSQDMVSRGFFGHVNPDGDGPQERAAAGGWKGGVGENVAAHATLPGAHAGLFWSAAHRSNLLGDYRYLGIGVARGKNSLLYVTQNFAD